MTTPRTMLATGRPLSANGQPAMLLGRPRSARPPLWRQDHLTRNTSPSELWEMRMAFEPSVARAAAMNATPRELDHIVELHHAADPARFVRSIDVAFHRAIAQASHNSLAAFLVERLTEMSMDPIFAGRYPPLTRETGFDHHQVLVEALVARDAARAERAMMTHLHAIAVWAAGLGAPEGTA